MRCSGRSTSLAPLARLLAAERKRSAAEGAEVFRDAHEAPVFRATCLSLRYSLEMTALCSYWIARHPFDLAGFAPRFGVTGHSFADALDIVVWSGISLRADQGYFHVDVAPSYNELLGRPGFRDHVEFNMGPMVCRGMWYPWITAEPPRPRRFRMEQPMTLPPRPKLSACLAALEVAAIRLRILGFAGEDGGMAPHAAAEVAALADAVHNLPYLIQHWDSCDEELLRDMLGDCDRRFPYGRHLLDAYLEAHVNAG